MTFGSPRMATGFQYSLSLRRTRRLTPVKTLSLSFTRSLVGVCIHLHSLTVVCGTPRQRAKLAFTVNCLSQYVCCILWEITHLSADVDSLLFYRNSDLNMNCNYCRKYCRTWNFCMRLNFVNLLNLQNLRHAYKTCKVKDLCILTVFG